MIQLEHINLVVSDIPAMLNFYHAVFPHWKIRDEGKGEWSGKPRNWLHFGDDYQYIALSDHGEGENRNLDGHQVGLAHFAYVTNNLDAVINRLLAAGYEIIEWWYAELAGGDEGIAFLGSQGDIWDAQKDMLCDTVGAVLSLFLMSAQRRFSQPF